MAITILNRGVSRATRLREPLWAKEILGDLKVTRKITSGPEAGQYELTFQFIARGGWRGMAGTVSSAEYIGWRDTGVMRGDGDAWLCINKAPDGKIAFSVYGVDLTVTYKDVPVSPITGAYLFLGGKE
jgi:hypothetical protein